MKKLKSVVGLACEYIANGQFGKYNLVNMYPTGDIIVQSFPAIVPMAFYIELDANFSGEFEIQIEILLGKKLVVKLGSSIQFEQGKLGLIALPQLPLELAAPSVLKVVAKVEDIKPTTLIQKRFIHGQIAGLPNV